VEASIRDAYYHNYFSLLVKDGTAQMGPDYIKMPLSSTRKPATAG